VSVSLREFTFVPELPEYMLKNRISDFEGQKVVCCRVIDLRGTIIVDGGIREAAVQNR
jgi:hypothetical protein